MHAPPASPGAVRVRGGVPHHRDVPADEELATAHAPLGIFEDMEFSSAAVSAHQGDLFALVTDGLTEAVDASDTELGLDPLKDAIRAHASHALSDIADRIVAVSRA